jgi:hypothetical protein
MFSKTGTPGRLAFLCLVFQANWALCIDAEKFLDPVKTVGGSARKDKPRPESGPFFSAKDACVLVQSV